MKSHLSVDEYIGQLQIWKEEISMLREIVLSVGLTETIKWGGPCYMWQNENVVGLAAFKTYIGLWFFQGGLLDDKLQYLMNAQEGKTKAMRQWRFSNKNEIMAAPIREYILESVENFKAGKKIKPVPQTSEIVIPEVLKTAIHCEPKLLERWQTFTLSSQKEFAGYISEAKRDTTREERLQKILHLILQGKNLHDKYKK
jgi:uncharacterized protein YdeI (YjbR/CyaY-like superfamily)